MLSGAVIALVQASSTPTGHHQLWGSDADPYQLWGSDVRLVHSLIIDYYYCYFFFLRFVFI